MYDPWNWVDISKFNTIFEVRPDFLSENVDDISTYYLAFLEALAISQ